MKMYYTYAYLRVNRTPYYIGKGKIKNNRYYRVTSHHSNTTVPPIERILILKEFESEFDAYKHEIYMIKVYGRKDKGTGILHNLTDGGEGASNPSDYSRKRTSETHKGKILSEEVKNKISLTRKKRGYVCSEQLKQKYSKIYAGEGNPNYGKKHSKETLAKISENTKNKNLKVRWYMSPDGEIIEIKNLREFCEKNDLSYISMIRVHNENYSTHKGYTKYDIKNQEIKINKKVKTIFQKWKCLETGFVSNPGNLTKYQKKRGIDVSKRIRIDFEEVQEDGFM